MVVWALFGSFFVVVSNILMVSTVWPDLAKLPSEAMCRDKKRMIFTICIILIVALLAALYMYEKEHTLTKTAIALIPIFIATISLQYILYRVLKKEIDFESYLLEKYYQDKQKMYQNKNNYNKPVALDTDTIMVLEDEKTEINAELVERSIEEKIDTVHCLKLFNRLAIAVIAISLIELIYKQLIR